jgi:PPK2 family polyphosphate:nucleotide phosphotransferase
MAYGIRPQPGKKVKLGDIDPNMNGGLDRGKGEEKVLELAKEFGELQELLYSAATHSLLVILQGIDTSGKDGTIRSVFREANPLGTRVVPFKVPTPLEKSHDFLWRIHQQVPERGIVTVFNRSHYEDVLVARVHELVPKSIWSQRYEHINAFEQLLAESNTLILKFFLHISKEEQEERLLAREREVEKAWKLSAADWVERRSWDKYMTAYEDAIQRCNGKNAPWIIVPANRKWFRNVVVVEAVVDLLRPYRDVWIESLADRGRAESEAIRAARGERGMK